MSLDVLPDGSVYVQCSFCGEHAVLPGDTLIRVGHERRPIAEWAHDDGFLKRLSGWVCPRCKKLWY